VSLPKSVSADSKKPPVLRERPTTGATRDQ
jgi:hypothetical protein